MKMLVAAALAILGAVTVQAAGLFTCGALGYALHDGRVERVCSAPVTTRWAELGKRFSVLAELRRFERFWEPKYLSLLEPTPKGRHYSGVDGTGAAVILGDGWAGTSSLSFCSNRRSSASGSV